MSNKNEGSKRTFVPKKIVESLNKINQNFSYRFGKIEFLIHTKWRQIVGDFFADHSEPIKINSIKSGTSENGEIIYSNCLYVNVSPASAIEFQHFKDKIIEKINSYFGYKAVEDLKIKQNFSPKIDNKNDYSKKKIILNEELKQETNKIKDKNLEESIVKLGLSISNEDK